MASGQTQYYGLSQWEAADKVERVDFNSDNARVDGALRALAEQAGRKADKSTVANLSSVVSQKADETALSAAEGRIYDFYAPGEYAQEAPAEPWERLRVSVDYGTVNPTSMGLWALKDGVWYRVDEYYYDSRTEGRQKTDEEYVDALEELTRGRRIERVMRANNAVADGLRVTADLLKKRRLVICWSCKDCLREMESYEWVNDGSGHDVPRKENDHAMDEMRYFAMSVAAGRGAMPTACAVTRTTNWRGAAER